MSSNVPLGLASGPLEQAQGASVASQAQPMTVPRVIWRGIPPTSILRDSVAGLFAKIVVVDAGSRDRTREIAQEFGAWVFDFVWVDDFAAAKNAALARATGDYAFWLDADDVIDPPERAMLKALLG
jgi:cellulose synthase/poly-beta-1,6-N-acetylglucosamine synthase-like glycosyltransferase